MNKKLVAIIVGTLAVVAIVLISIFGIQPENRDTHKNVIKVEILTPNVEPTTYRDDDNTLVTTLIMDTQEDEYQIQWRVLPSDATNKAVTFTSDNTNYATVDADGKVTFLQTESVQITVKSVDDTTKKAIINFVFPSPTESYLNLSINDDNVDVDLLADAHLLHAYSSNQLVLLEGASYGFGLGEDLSLSLPENTNATLNENMLSTAAAEEFVLTITKTVADEENVVKTVSVKVVPYVAVFNMGSQYASYLETMADFQKPQAQQTSEFLNKTVAPYLVGKDSEFYFNISLKRPNNGALTQSEIELEYTVKDISNNPVTLTDIATLSGNNLLFKEAAADNVYTFTVAPKYNQIFNRIPLTYTIKVADGVNVWTNDQMYNAYKTLNVTGINLHSSLVVTPRANQIYVVTRDEVQENRLNNYTGLDSGSDTLRDNSGSMFPRYIPTTYSGINRIVVNGNFFSIDGSSLPYYNYEKTEDGQHGALSWAPDISSVQEGMFQLHDNRDYTVKNDQNYSETVFNNLIIKGNSAKGPIYTENDPEGDLEDEDVVKRLTDQGSGMPLLMTRGGRISMNNVVGKNSIFAFWSSRAKAELNLNYVKAYDIWGGAIYGYGTSYITLTNIEFTRLGGAAISYEDSSYSDWLNPAYSEEYKQKLAGYTEDYLDLVLTFNENVVINNYLTGDEGWFVVNGFTGAVTILKGQVDPTINMAEKSMVDSSTGTEQFNYILQITSSGGMDRPSDDLLEVDIQYTIRQMIAKNEETDERTYRETVRKNGFKTSHPFTSLAAAGGNYLGSLGSYSNIEAFKQLQHTIAVVDSYLRGEALALDIVNDNPLLAGTIQNIYQAIVGYPITQVPFSALDSEAQQQVLLAISGYQSEDGTVDVNAMTKALLDQHALVDSATVAGLRALAEASADTKMSAFAIGLNIDNNKATENILEIIPGFELDGRQLALFVEYFDKVPA